MNNLDIVLALFTTPNHRFSRLDTTAAFQAATSATSNWVSEGRRLGEIVKFRVSDFLDFGENFTEFC
jgi:hypothetical protein